MVLVYATLRRDVDFGEEGIVGAVGSIKADPDQTAYAPEVHKGCEDTEHQDGPGLNNCTVRTFRQRGCDMVFLWKAVYTPYLLDCS